MGRDSGQTGERFLLWIDAVGGYLVLMQDEVVLGQPAPQSRADVPILGDISGRHARICRDGEGYLLEALRPAWVNGRSAAPTAMLTDGSTIRLGDAVNLSFRRPHALSATARLDFLSPHRTQPSVDAVLLMADSCVLGPRPQSHVMCRHWPNEVILYRYEDRLQCRTRGWIEIDGVKYKDRGPVRLGSRIVGEPFSMSLEAF
ncbi:MAG: hypothetical protein HUU20_13035 [Pirellulales bacterium]|nr:hypothetical protein [Pirellulales bacterium]